MSSSAQLDPSCRFLDVARELSLLSADTARDLATEAHTRNVQASQLILQRGLLTPTQIDIVETLCAPRDAVPGYETLGLIGYGGMGVVYRARQLALDRVVALKTVLVSELAADPAAVGRFEQEATLAARLAHPHIVTAYDFGRHRGRLFFAMELVAGEDADRLVRRTGKLSEALAWAIIRQAAAGLAHAQQLGIVHRDIKPANLLLVEPPAGFPLSAGVPLVKIADFGLARLVQEDVERTRLTSTSAAVGSPLYMAPEQLRAERVDHRADIYALGATAYHLLSGQAPLAGHTMVQIVGLKLTGKIPDLRSHAAEISGASADLVTRLMAVEPHDRPQSYADVIGRIDGLPLDRIADGAQPWNFPPAAGGGSTSPTVSLSAAATAPIIRGRLPRRRAWLAGAIGVGAIALFTLLAALWFSASESPGERDLTPTGRAEYLFDGQKIDQWLPLSGGWYPQSDADGGLVLEGNGVVRRAVSISRPAGGAETLNYYRLVLFLYLRDAAALEVQFDLAAANGPRQLVRITADGSRLGRRASDSATPQLKGPIVPLVLAAERPHVVQIERHSLGWWVLVDEQLVGAVVAENALPLPEFRVLVEGGAAWISDVTVEELAPPSASPAVATP